MRVGTGQIGIRTAQELLRGTCQCSRGRHGLVDLVSERRRGSTYEIESRSLCRLRLLGREPRLDLAHRLERVLALGYDDADRETGGTEDEHQQLELGERTGVIAILMQQPDQAELGDGKRDAAAIEPVARCGDHHRQEQQIEQLGAVRPGGDEDDPQGRDHDRDEQKQLGHNPKRDAIKERARMQSKP